MRSIRRANVPLTLFDHRPSVVFAGRCRRRLNRLRASPVVSGVIEEWVALRERGVEVLAADLGGSAERRAAAFSTLLDRALDRSFRLAAVILRDRDEAEDAVSDAALRAWQHVSALRDPARFDAWFTRILVNVCRDRLHQRSRRREAPPSLLSEPGDRADPIGDFVERAALRDALAALTPEHRAVVALHHLEGLTDEQIALQLNVPVGTVKSRLHYALAGLRAAYDAALREPEPISERTKP